MRRTRSAVTTAVVILCGLAVVPSTAFAASNGPRLASCSEAWTAIATEQAGLESDDPAAWARVSDAFISMSDASFDGPLSNALGNVSTAASDHAAALNADGQSDPSTTAFGASLAALGTVCATLNVTSHKQSVPRFQHFSFQDGNLTGLSPDGSQRATATMTAVVNRGATAAKRATRYTCLGSAKRCAYYVQTLSQRRCESGFVCVLSTSGLLASGANSGQDWADTFVFDGRTGQPVLLSQVVSASQQTAFVNGVNASVKAALAREGMGNDPFWKPRVAFKDVRAWLPQPDGIHVWFDKYAVAPGYLGIVHVVVPWSTVKPST
jgi:hypothetical protein